MITFLLSYIWMGLNFGVASVETHIVCVICIDSQWTWYRAAFICQIYRDPELSHPWSCVVYNQRHHRQMTQHSLALIWRMVDSISIAWALSLKNGKLLKLCQFDTVLLWICWMANIFSTTTTLMIYLQTTWMQLLSKFVTWILWTPQQVPVL